MFHVKQNEVMDFKIIAIDGPTGVGKSTIAKMLAKELSFFYVNTGAMFRCLAYRWNQQGLPENEEALQELGNNTQIDFRLDGTVWCNQKNVTETIRTEENSQLSSKVSKFPIIRQVMKNQQRQLVENIKKEERFRGAVLEGRDIGTVVFPNAHRKFFLEADNKIRAARRHKQLKEKGNNVPYEEVLAALEERDFQDRNRAVAPLRPAEDAILIDTDQLSIPDVLQAMLKVI